MFRSARKSAIQSPVMAATVVVGGVVVVGGLMVVGGLVVVGGVAVVLGAGVVVSVPPLHAEAASNTTSTTPCLFTV